MASGGERIFVGFGFGAIQAGLFLHEAIRSECFGRLVVAEVLPELVAAVRAAQGWVSVNVAHPDRIEVARVGPVQIGATTCPDDCALLAEAVADAQEISTAVPSVRNYVSAQPGSIHRVLAQGLRKKAERGGPKAIIYAAENHNRAAEILEEKVFLEIPATEQAAVRACVRFLNTVIGKMSGTVTDRTEVQQMGLASITASVERAFLVEAFNRILISRIRFGDDAVFQRGIKVFEEKDDLIPFEEAKLYGHNATHALAAYVGAVMEIKKIADLRAFPDVMRFLRAAFIEESGEALIRKHRAVDRLFTPEGYRAYADDLIARMVNPYLQDTVERVGRDTERKLGWDDRLVGTMRMALRQGVKAGRFALGVAAALETLNCGGASTAALLDRLWRDAVVDPGERSTVLQMVEAARHRLHLWRAGGFTRLESG